MARRLASEKRFIDFKGISVIKTVLLAGALIFLTAATSPQPTPEQVLAEASRYTVKIQVQNEIALSQDQPGSASGTGFLIDRERGWLLTNAHVATRSPATIKLQFKDGKQLIAAKRIHVDPFMDLAILEIPSQSVPAGATQAELACDQMPVPGTSVLAFGHPWGLSFTASRGIVSGLAWFYPNRMIQTDAAINSGNSGGPLISLTDGRVIGINTSTYQPQEDGAGATAIGLAETMPAVCRIVDLLKAGTDTALRMPPFAVAVSGDDLRPRVAKVFESGSGFRSGDVVTMVNGTMPVETLPDLLSGLRGVVGEAVITVERNGKPLDVRSPVRIIPDPLKVQAINLSGLIIAEPWRVDDFEVNPEGNLGVDFIEWGQEAEFTNAQPFDYIVSVDGQEFQSVKVLYAYLESLPEDATVEIMLERETSSSDFHREYRHINLSKEKLEWVSTQ
jgi:serine protease Do